MAADAAVFYAPSATTVLPNITGRSSPTVRPVLRDGLLFSAEFVDCLIDVPGIKKNWEAGSSEYAVGGGGAHAAPEFNTKGASWPSTEAARSSVVILHRVHPSLVLILSPLS
jgi:hypothetical protein